MHNAEEEIRKSVETLMENTLPAKSTHHCIQLQYHNLQKHCNIQSLSAPRKKAGAKAKGWDRAQESSFKPKNMCDKSLPPIFCL